MRIYLDTGIFIDYLISRGYATPYLRPGVRRGRDASQLLADVERCFSKIGATHHGLTSSLTFYEAEEALYEELSKKFGGVAHKRKYVVASARPIMTQMLITAQLHDIDVLELTSQTVKRQLEHLGLQMSGIRAGDSAHMVTAILNDADVVLSSDKHILGLDKTCQNLSGAAIRCWDTDVAASNL